MLRTIAPWLECRIPLVMGQPAGALSRQSEPTCRGLPEEKAIRAIAVGESRELTQPRLLHRCAHCATLCGSCRLRFCPTKMREALLHCGPSVTVVVLPQDSIYRELSLEFGCSTLLSRSLSERLS